ncbi:hypothetical protein NitYY0826_C1223 [Nitratiruptor sp. YY08-26]|uniref:mechanosensitive ion channel family protein n=1 Tax=unclassified Nitratiruptor TaxID=2624044 RepID=UPI001915977D|nr:MULTISPECIES: mechanosensitive ion channel domain-containing protein [unclassified Nitratiruptor]BCD62347.1 hypothetical protein NitYY0813_C1221 [Nitratiruptor sp. YY08-13]BCD66283.1 hypothetical protein NitYY0826_C1223 [Nitratiruptor sp. YY08-26]
MHKKKVDMLAKVQENIKNLLISGIKSIPVQKSDSAKALAAIDDDLQKIRKKIQAYNIELERRVLLGKDTSYLQKQIDFLQKKERQSIEKKLGILFQEFLFALQTNRSKDVFSLKKKIVNLTKKYYSSDLTDAINELLSTLATSILGKAQTLKGATFEEIKTLLKTIWKKANEPLFTINGIPISSFKLFLALLIFIMGIFIGTLYKSYVKNISYRSKNFTQSTATLLANLGYYLLVIIAFFLALNTLGIDLSSLAIVAGALSVGIGFGLQNIVSNFVSGIILMFERSIKIGDYLEIDGELRGHVSDIRMRSTTITTNDNIDVIVPNQDLIQNKVINWTMNDRIRRFRIPFGVAYGTDVHKVIKVVKKAVEKSGFTDIYNTPKRHTRVIMTGMGNSSVDFELLVWVKGEEILYPKRTTSRFLILIYDALYEHGIEIPFPQRDIHIRKGDAPIEVVLKKEEDS